MPRFTTLPDWLAWQETLHPKAIDLGLERVARVARQLQLTTLAVPVVTVAGTNGKGSTIAMLESVLQTAGYRTGAYTSPHLQRYNERIRIQGRDIDDQSLCDAFAAVDAARDEVSLSYFEFATLAALLLFREASLDVVLLEVGLGGRLDAVNIIDADVAIVTSVDIDHSDWLGEDRESIGIEKAGIFRADRPAICSDPAPPASLSTCAGNTGAHWYGLGGAYRYQTGQRHWQWHGPQHSYDRLALPALAGEHQLHNAAGAVMALECLQLHLPVSAEDISNGLQGAALPARCQFIAGAIELVLDVAHNPDSARRLATLLSTRPCQGDTHLLLGMLADKDIAGTCQALAAVADHWYLTGLQAERGLTADVLRQRLPTAVANTAVCFDNAAQALQQARATAVTGDRIVICGSFYTVAAAMACGV
ncbi:MAG: bifunctional tetrahydrofolate synthase/dihydrofolate synthase [Pseudomonadota bacterium]